MRLRLGLADERLADRRAGQRVSRTHAEWRAGFEDDPFFPAWPDTLQLDYANPGTQKAMLAELLRVAGKCDGVRCDMAMLVLPDIFERTWGRRPAPFWPAAMSQVRKRTPRFCFLAEVYWDLEATLIAQGFDYAYDKRLYDLLRSGDAHSIPHLARAADESVDEGLQQFYDALLALLREPASRDGNFALRDCAPAWDGNGSNDAFVAWTCDDPRGGRRLVAVNYAPHRGQCYLRFADAALDGVIRLRDLMGPARYERDGRELSERGLYLDLPAWGYHVFEVA